MAHQLGEAELRHISDMIRIALQTEGCDQISEVVSGQIGRVKADTQKLLYQLDQHYAKKELENQARQDEMTKKLKRSEEISTKFAQDLTQKEQEVKILLEKLQGSTKFLGIPLLESWLNDRQRWNTSRNIWRV